MLKPCMYIQEAGSFWAENAEWIFPLIVTVIFAVISWRYERAQKQLAEYEVGISLMEKRMAVYDSTRLVLEDIVTKPEKQLTSVEDFSKSKRVSQMLFGNEICTLMEKVSELITQVNTNNSAYAGVDGGMPISAASPQKRTQYAEEAQTLLSEADILFRKYVDFSSIGIIRGRFSKKPSRNNGSDSR